MSNYPNRPFFYTILSAFRPYSAPKTTASTSTKSTAGTTSHKFSTSPQAAPHNATATASSSSTHAQITQAATARAIASKSSTSGQTQGFAQAAAAFSPPSHHHQKHHHTATTPPSGRRGPYGSQGFGNTRPRRGSDSSGDEGFMQRPGVDSWCIGGRRANGEQNFYKLSMVRRERSNDRKSCDRLSL